MERLASLAQQLQASVGAFKLRDNSINNALGRNILSGPGGIGNMRSPSNALHTFAGAASNAKGGGRYPAPPARTGKNGAFAQYPVPTSPYNEQRSYPMPGQNG
jgi:hypothetical protein